MLGLWLSPDKWVERDQTDLVMLQCLSLNICNLRSHIRESRFLSVLTIPEKYSHEFSWLVSPTLEREKEIVCLYIFCINSQITMSEGPLSEKTWARPGRMWRSKQYEHLAHRLQYKGYLTRKLHVQGKVGRKTPAFIQFPWDRRHDHITSGINMHYKENERVVSIKCSIFKEMRHRKCMI